MDGTSSWLPLMRRLEIALGAGLGCQLTSGEVEDICRLIVVARKIDDRPSQRHRIREALKPFE